MILVFQIIFICLFGYSYAIVFFEQSESVRSDKIGENTKLKESVYRISGHWIEVVLVSFLIAVFVYWVIDPAAFVQSFWLVLIVSGTSFMFSSIVYRVKKTDALNNNELSWVETSKFALVCPAILMIGVNIYLGSSVFSLLKGEMIFYLPVAVFILFFIAFYLLKLKNDTTLYMVFLLLSFVIGALSLIPYLSISFRNLFLAVMASIFLAIFESWYVVFRQMKNRNSDNIIKYANFIILAAPIVVFMLFPLQNFGSIYLFSFCGGILVVQYTWLYNIKPKAEDANKSEEDIKKYSKQVGTLRGIFGILVFIFLILDINYGNYLMSLQASFVKAGDISSDGMFPEYANYIVLFLDSVVFLVYRNISNKIKDGMQRNIFKALSIRILFLLVPLVALYFYAIFIPGIDTFKINAVKCFIMIFAAVDFISINYLLIRNNVNQRTEKDLEGMSDE